VAELYVQGKTQAEISTIVGVGQPTFDWTVGGRL
jgi:hypothetical protein